MQNIARVFRIVTAIIGLSIFAVALILMDHSYRLWRGASVPKLPDHIYELLILLVVALSVIIPAARRT